MRYLLLIALLCLVGCHSEAPYTDNSRDSAAYAVDVKRVILEHVETARKSSEPGDQVLTIVTELRQSKDRPVGEQGPIYADLLAKAEALLNECNSAPNGKPASLSRSLDELVKTTQTLPGEVVLLKRD